MSRPLAALGLLFGFAVARTLDAAWVLFWFGGTLHPPLAARIAADAGALLVAGALAGWLGLWLAGSRARGLGLWLGILLVAASLLDLAFGIANAPWWHEALTVLAMAPAAVAGGGDLPRRLRRTRARR